MLAADRAQRGLAEALSYCRVLPWAGALSAAMKAGKSAIQRHLDQGALAEMRGERKQSSRRMAREFENRSLEELKEALATGRYRPRERGAVKEEISRREQRDAADRGREEIAPVNEALLRARLSDRRSSFAVVISLLALAVAGLALLADPDALELLRDFFERGGEE